MSVTVTVTSRIPQIMARTRPLAMAAVAKTVQDIETGAKSRAPVDTGNLRNSIQGSVGGLSGQVSVGAHYGIYVEFGTYKMSAQPYFIPAVEAARGPFLKAMEAIVRA